jgi:uncharacterized membrane protein HdeD (DUF308 family)
MQFIVSKYWWFFFARGCLALLFGLVALVFWPILELVGVGVFFGVFILLQGVIRLITYLKIKGTYKALPVLAESVLVISIGAFLVTYPYVTTEIFLVSFVAGGLGFGLLRAIFSFPFFRTRRSFWIFMRSDIVLILLFVVFDFQTALQKQQVVWVLSIYFLVYGFPLIIFGLNLMSRSRQGR